MHASEGKLRRTVIERRRFPHRRRMTGLAGMADSAGDVIRIGWGGKISGMARVATRVCELVVAIRMT